MSQAQSTAYQNPVKFLSTGRDQRFFEHNTATGEFSFADIVLDQMNDEMLKHLEDITDYKELAYFARNRDKS
jgi:hypothetical protein